jgi:hypothetical protein
VFSDRREAAEIETTLLVAVLCVIRMATKTNKQTKREVEKSVVVLCAFGIAQSIKMASLLPPSLVFS